jgi:S1-C subfamily serine protease
MNRRIGLFLSALLLALLACTLPTTAPTVLQSIPTLETVVNPVAPAPAPGDPAAPAADLAALYRDVDPGVVAIWTFTTVSGAHETAVPIGQGTGFVIDRQGHIITNQHVVADAEEIEVDFPSGTRAWLRSSART